MSTLYTTITRQGVVSLWPIRLPLPDGRYNEWHRSAAEAAELAMTALGSGEGQPGVGRLRNVRAGRHHPGTRMADKRRWPSCCGSRLPTAWSIASTTPSFGDCAGYKPMLEAWPYREVWAVDFEFMAPPGERQIPVCLVARELRSGRTIRLWQDQFGPTPPFPIGADVLFVAYYASAELGCFRALGWPMPARILDLFAEFRDATNGLTTPAGAGLLGALTYFGLDAIGATEKDRDARLGAARAAHGRATERAAILDYCESDVVALARLLPACCRASTCRVRWCGAATWRQPQPWNTRAIPIDVADAGMAARALDRHPRPADRRDRRRLPGVRRPYVQARAVRGLAGAGRHTVAAARKRPARLSDDTFRRAAKAYPAVSPLRELRSALADLRLNALAVGRDGRNRTILSAFRSRTGRNQPSNSKYIFGTERLAARADPTTPGHGVAYIDWSQQEFGIAAALSGDVAMQAAYQSGDPYLAFAKQAGAVPADGTKKTHEDVRELFKQCVLAVQYGMEAPGVGAADCSAT